MDVKAAIESGDAQALRRVLAEDASRVNALVCWGKDGRVQTHPLHYVSDMLFAGTLPRGKELPLIEVLIQAGADLNFQRDEGGRRSDTPLIGAASLGAEDAGLALLAAGARRDIRGMFGETALHWAAFLGEDRLVAALIGGSDVNLKDDKFHSPPLGWAIHGCYSSPGGNHGKQREVAALLVQAKATVETAWLELEDVMADPVMLSALRAGAC